MSKLKYRESGAYVTTHVRLKATILEFVEYINAGDDEALMNMQTDDFTFIDMSGNVFTGRQSWDDYFTPYPDYRIHVDRIVTGGDGVAITPREGALLSSEMGAGADKRTKKAGMSGQT